MAVNVIEGGLSATSIILLTSCLEDLREPGEPIRAVLRPWHPECHASAVPALPTSQYDRRCHPEARICLAVQRTFFLVVVRYSFTDFHYQCHLYTTACVKKHSRAACSSHRGGYLQFAVLPRY